MNTILNLHGEFQQISNGGGASARNITKGKSVTIAHLEKLKKDIQNVKLFWQHNKILKHPLISVYYDRIIAKSNRIESIITKGNEGADTSIVGAKFTSDGSKHIITHCINCEDFDKAINRIDICIEIVQEVFGNEIKYDHIVALNKKELIPDDDFYYLKGIVEECKKVVKSKDFYKTKFSNILVDAFYVERFGVDQERVDCSEKTIISIYDTGENVDDIFNKLGISYYDKIDNTAILMQNNQYQTLVDKAPYLVAMAVEDLAEMEPKDIKKANEEMYLIPPPSHEPTIGVIDTLFDESVYFKDWVDFEPMLKEELIDSIDYIHGTMVSSIIVDGPTLNPDLDDGCGRFRVRHFGVAKGSKYSSFDVLKSIKEIVSNNTDIKVWNLSLGDMLPISPNFISPEAAVLDQIQYDYGVIFVVAATNKDVTEPERKIGAPADSINSLVVGAVDFDKIPTSYSRKGGVLSFFVKPDLCYYGGTEKERIKVYSPEGVTYDYGTSLAAPWITRKLAYMIEIIKLPREVAKALLIDASIGWNEQTISPEYLGYGVPPIRIEDILQSQDDEIRIILTGTSEKFNTYNYNIPLPVQKDKQPYIAKATLCYFPKCTRSQGVDYTNTEMDFHFGRVTEKGLKSIDNNSQGAAKFINLPENDVRKLYRKWDNVKHINEVLKQRSKPKKSYGNGLWGLNIKTKERLDGHHDGTGLHFGVVITFKELNGVNRIDEFIHACQTRLWIVERIDIEAMAEIHEKAEEIVVYDD